MANGKKIIVRLAEVLSFVFLLLAFLPIILKDKVPEIIPTHFDFMGQADDWSPRSSLWILPVISAAFFAVFTVLSVWPAKTYRFNGKKTKNNGSFIALTTELLRYLKLIFTAMFAYMVNVSAGFIGDGNLNPWIMWGLIGIMAVTVISFTVKAYKTANQETQI